MHPPCRQLTSENYSSAFLTVARRINKLEFAERQIHSWSINLLKTRAASITRLVAALNSTERNLCVRGFPVATRTRAF